MNLKDKRMKPIIFSEEKVKNTTLIKKRVIITMLVIWFIVVTYLGTFLFGFNKGVERNKSEISLLNEELGNEELGNALFTNDFDNKKILKDLLIFNDLEYSINEYKRIKHIPENKTIPTKDLLAYICASTKKYDLDAIEITAQIAVESDFYKDAYSDADCKGFMQISEGALNDYNQVNKTDYKWEDVTVPSINIEIGCWYMRHLKDDFNKQGDQTLYCYNAGPFGKPGIKESTDYVNKINKIKSDIKESLKENFS